jgi:protein involved in polysaccharide export with SLBB domain
LKAGGRLIDALVDAGGFASTASGEVLVQRREGTFDDGTTIKRFRFQSSGPSVEDRTNLSIALRPGDLVTARPRQYVLVQGEVARPGRYELSDGMTVTGVLEAAGGTTRYGHPKVSLERARPEEGEPKKVDVDTRAVRSGEAPDPILRSDDTLQVRPRKL